MNGPLLQFDIWNTAETAWSTSLFLCLAMGVMDKGH
jgi:hypothetical protein